MIHVNVSTIEQIAEFVSRFHAILILIKINILMAKITWMILFVYLPQTGLHWKLANISNKNYNVNGINICI